MLVGQAAITITAPTLAIGSCTFPSIYSPLGAIVLDENVTTDISLPAPNALYTIILSPPANFEFQAATGSVVANGGDITTITMTVAPGSITIQYASNEAVRGNEDDIITVSGLMVRAMANASGNVVRSASTPGTATINGLAAGTAVAGLSTFIRCLPGGVPGVETWMKADAGVTGSAPITAWANQNTSGTAIGVNGAPTLNTSSPAYNYNPYVEMAGPASPRQYLSISGQDYINGLAYHGLFLAGHLTDLGRFQTHLAVVAGVSVTTPANGTLHGGDDGAAATLQKPPYDPDFETANVWHQNGTSVGPTARHLARKHILSTVSQNGNTTTINRFLGGQNDEASFVGHPRDWRGPVAELIGYSAAITPADRQKIETYLAVKYGATLGIDYVACNGTTIYSPTGAYTRNIIGIGSDGQEGLAQKQSHTDDDSVRVYISALAATNQANTGTFSADASFVMIGSNSGRYCASPASSAEVPPGCLLTSRLEREWKLTKTGFGRSFNLDIKLAACAQTALVNTSHLRLVVDDDGNFNTGAASCYYNGDGTGITITYSAPTVTITGLSNTHFPDNATRYFTLASISPSTPLPVELLSFEAFRDGARTALEWTTASERGNDRFEVERSRDGVSFEVIARVPGAGDSQGLLAYTAFDEQPFPGWDLYRLRQVDLDGTSTLSEVRAVRFEDDAFSLYPNPARDELELAGGWRGGEVIRIFSGDGRLVRSLGANSDAVQQVSLHGLAPGSYYVQVSAGPVVLQRRSVIVADR
ncbi:MAG: T9SS type A sorting domain-containing protein [Bacteroidetes bacterium]|nr:T9SS type A sorting domain-containing protein [Bacteroidota bacterium]